MCVISDNSNNVIRSNTWEKACYFENKVYISGRKLFYDSSECYDKPIRKFLGSWNTDVHVITTETYFVNFFEENTSLKKLRVKFCSSFDMIKIMNHISLSLEDLVISFHNKYCDNSELLVFEKSLNSIIQKNINLKSVTIELSEICELRIPKNNKVFFSVIENEELIPDYQRN